MANGGPVWRLLGEPRKPGDDGYFDHVRVELLGLFAEPPRLFVDIGCGTGATAEEAKRRFPDATVMGFEFSPDAAAIAAHRLDRVVSGNVEQIDLATLGLEPGSIDGLLLADVLEHLYDPWALLVRLRPYLARNVQIVASIPNARNLLLLNELASGDFHYVEAGLLDITHIRFFTKRSILEMFAQTGYEVTGVLGADDARIPPFGEFQLPADLSTASLTLRNLDAEALQDLRTIQFFVTARLAQAASASVAD
jgi:O-antigen biosynthesis protein